MNVSRKPSQKSTSIMTRPVHYDDALVTSIVRYHEADCIVRLFTRESGCISAFYKRGLIPKRGSSPIQAPALAQIGLINKSDKLARLISCDHDPTSGFLSLKAFGYSSYIAEIIEKFLPEGDPAPEIFQLIVDAFSSLRNGAYPCLLRAFELKVLNFCGYLPEMPTTTSQQCIVGFDPITTRFTTKKIEGAFDFSHDALMLAKSMLIAKLGSVNYEGARELLMIGRIFQNRLKLMGCFPLKSVAFLKQVSGRKH